MINVKKKLHISTLVHYLLIYLMLLVPASSFYQKVMPSSLKYIIFLVSLFFAIFIKKYRNIFTFIPLIIVTFFTVIVRVISGGVGVSSIIDLVTPVFVLNLAFNFNRKEFLTRFVKLSTIFFVISLLFFIVQITYKDFFNLPIFYRYFSQTLGTKIWSVDYYGKGFLLFSVYDIHPTRNCGIFTEPGVYQIYVNACLIVLMFCNDRLNFSNKKTYLYVFISLLTLVTSQSTSGFIALIILIAMYTFYKDKDKKLLRYLYILCFFAVVFLVGDYIANGESSTLYENFIHKLFNNGSIDFDNGSGYYRMETLRVSFESMFKAPWGIGYDKFSIINVSTNAGGGFYAFGAVYGVLPFIIMSIWLIYPYIQKRKIFFLILFLLIFINTSLAQTYFLYPGLLILNYRFYFDKNQKGKDFNE